MERPIEYAVRGRKTGDHIEKSIDRLKLMREAGVTGPYKPHEWNEVRSECVSRFRRKLDAGTITHAQAEAADALLRKHG